MSEKKIYIIPIATRPENSYGFVGTNTFKENIPIDGFFTVKHNGKDAFKIESELPIESIVDKVSEILYLLALSNPNYAHHEIFYGGISETSPHSKIISGTVSLDATSERGSLKDIEQGLLSMRGNPNYEDIKQAVYWYHQGTLVSDRAGKFSALYFAFETMMRLHESKDDIQTIWQFEKIEEKQTEIFQQITTYLQGHGLGQISLDRAINSLKNTKNNSETDTYLRILSTKYELYPSKKQLNNLRSLRGSVFHKGNKQKAEEGLGLLMRLITLILDIEIYGSPKFLKDDSLLKKN